MPQPLYPVNPAVQEFLPYSPGLSIDEIQNRYGLTSVIKLASNENPLGTSPMVQEVLCKKAGLAFRYAQSGNPRLVAALADFLGVDKDCLVVGNGSDEIIDLLMRVCPTPGKHSVLTNTPAFSIYGLQAKLCGVNVRKVPLATDFSFNWEGLLAAVDADTALVFLTTPDNPSGYCPNQQELMDFARRLPPTCLLVLDEAYSDFCDPGQDCSLLPHWENFPNTAFLRTFSKSWGLAGMRLGYGIFPASLAAAVRKVRLPFSVNILAEEAGIAVLADTAFRKATLEAVYTGRKWLQQSLVRLGCRVLPSQANFLMFSPPVGCLLSSLQIFEALLAKGIIIRPLKSYGLPDYLRVSIGTAKENMAFISMLEKVIAQ